MDVGKAFNRTLFHGENTQQTMNRMEFPQYNKGICEKLTSNINLIMKDWMLFS